MAGSSAELNAAAKALIHDPSEIFGNADAPAWLTLKLLTCTDVDLKKERAVGAKADLALWATWLRLKREVTNRDNVAIDLAIALMPGGQVPSGKTVETSLWPALIDSCARSPCPCRPCSGAASCARAPCPCRPCSGAASCARALARARAAPAAALLLVLELVRDMYAYRQNAEPRAMMKMSEARLRKPSPEERRQHGPSL